MTRPRIAYIAQLSPEEYARFRERDPGLPAMHADWVAEISKRMDALRRAGVKPALYPIGFDEMVTSLEILGVTAFDAATRDRYAEDMAAADANWSRL